MKGNRESTKYRWELIDQVKLNPVCAYDDNTDSPATWGLSTKVKGSVVGISNKEDKNMKITFLYTNGKKYVATRVTNFRETSGTISYSTDKKKGSVHEKSTFTIQKGDIVSYKLENGSETTVVDLLPCSNTKIELGKKK